MELPWQPYALQIWLKYVEIDRLIFKMMPNLGIYINHFHLSEIVLNDIFDALVLMISTNWKITMMKVPKWLVVH